MDSISTSGAAMGGARSGFPPLSDMALIGDRRTAALIGRDATVYWYCPHRFDRPSIFNALLDPAKGAWRIAFPGAAPRARRYLGRSAVLETRLAGAGGELAITDWMTMGADVRAGWLCRELSEAPSDTTITLDAWADHGSGPALPAQAGDAVVFANGMHLFASHKLEIEGNAVRWLLPRGEAGWTVLADAPCSRPSRADLARARASTLRRWDELAAAMAYAGPYEAALGSSLRQLHLLAFEPTGAIVAAATAGLPEVIRGQRNYDYRYVWVRDAALVIRALLRLEPSGANGAAFLEFVARSRDRSRRSSLAPVITVDGGTVPSESNPSLVGYRRSDPVRIGNRARSQLQIGALGNFLISAAMIDSGARRNWQTVRAVADFVVAHWQEPDSGIWESPEKRQYTVSKAFAACGLEAVAKLAEPARAASYRAAADEIRRYVMRHCLTPEGAFAAFAGSAAVDISAALFPVWSFCPADSPAMQATIAVLVRDYERDGLLRREDETAGSRQEGAFLPGTFWMSQYWAVRGDRARAQRYLEAGMACGNDLGIFPEEVDWGTKAALGNLPLGMTHASFINAVLDLAALL